MKQYQVGFIMFVEAGLQTQYLNWRTALASGLGITPEWIVMEWWREGGFIERLPVIPNGLKARLRAYQSLHTGLAKGPFDALFIAGKTLTTSQAILDRQPYFLTTDVTPKQMRAFGDLYINNQPSRFAFAERRVESAQRERYRRARALFPWSHWTAESMIEDYGVEASQIYVVPPGVDMQAWRCEPRDLTGENVNILFVGGDFLRKGGDLLLDWARKTLRKGWTLHLVTRDAVTPPNAQVRVYNDLTPNDPRLMQLYREAHIFALPTRGDCYSLAGIEAMAAGLPIILANVGGTGDIIRDGETGFLIPRGDGDALTDRLDYLLANPERCHTMGLAGRQDAERRYDACKNIQRTVDILRKAIEIC